MIDNLEILPVDGIRGRAHDLKVSGFRFVTMTACTNSDETVDIFYSFDYEYKLVTLKTTVPAGATVHSLSDVYLAAAFVENEISELFEVKFSDLAIDYGGRFMLAEGAPDSPFGAGVIIERKGGNGNAG
jgi:NADH:ubiquinone oxidoreductase subunit C